MPNKKEFIKKKTAGKKPAGLDKMSKEELLAHANEMPDDEVEDENAEGVENGVVDNSTDNPNQPDNDTGNLKIMKMIQEIQELVSGQGEVLSKFIAGKQDEKPTDDIDENDDDTDDNNDDESTDDKDENNSSEKKDDNSYDITI